MQEAGKFDWHILIGGKYKQMGDAFSGEMKLEQFYSIKGGKLLCLHQLDSNAKLNNTDMAAMRIFAVV